MAKTTFILKRTVCLDIKQVKASFHVKPDSFERESQEYCSKMAKNKSLWNRVVVGMRNVKNKILKIKRHRNAKLITMVRKNLYTASVVKYISFKVIYSHRSQSQKSIKK